MHCHISLYLQTTEEQLNIRTAIFHCIYRQLQTNSSNKINSTAIPLYFILQQQRYEDIYYMQFTVRILIIWSLFFLCLCFKLIANDFVSLSLSRLNSTTQYLYSIETTVRAKCIILIQYQKIAILYIELIFASSEPTPQ